MTFWVGTEKSGLKLALAYNALARLVDALKFFAPTSELRRSAGPPLFSAARLHFLKTSTVSPLSSPKRV
jgi:hypothetical protein